MAEITRTAIRFAALALEQSRNDIAEAKRYANGRLRVYKSMKPRDDWADAILENWRDALALLSQTKEGK